MGPTLGEAVEFDAVWKGNIAAGFVLRHKSSTIIGIAGKLRV